ncbi:unnamed protein product [Caenorhabditis auriculariae]|uniref:Uncharacterized protein n=1 Tax=Caenorhabditis auriculariae TaxID=2777116 RepID=A0A8S1HLG4_9PELO|nr:unnamed protein product [Caenorhabditis auriculariae]
MAQKMLTTLDDELVVVEKEIMELDDLYRRTGQGVALTAQEKAFDIRQEILRLNEALLHFQHNCVSF